MPSGYIGVLTPLQYLTANQTLSSSQYLVTAQSGTEATSGKATLTYVLLMHLSACLTFSCSSTYSIVIN